MVSVMIILLMLAGTDRGFEPIEADGPIAFPLAEPPLRFGERPGIEAAQVRASHLLARDEAGALEHLHMLGRSREAHAVRLGERTDRGLAERELGEHAAPRRIGQCMEHSVKSIINHLVEYRFSRFECQPFS